MSNKGNEKKQQGNDQPGKRDFITLNVKGWLGGTVRMLTPTRRSIWIDLLAMSGDGRFPGWVATGYEGGKLVGWKVKTLATRLGYNYQAFKQALDLFKEQGRIEITEEEAIRIVNWDKYQFIPSHRCEPGVKDGCKITPPSLPASSPTSHLSEAQPVENKEQASPYIIPDKTTPQTGLAEWSEDIEDGDGIVPAERIRRAVRYVHSPECGLDWYKENLSAHYIRNNARKLVEMVPENWGRPKPSRRKAAKGRGCDACAFLGFGVDNKPCPHCSDELAPHDAPASPPASPALDPAPPPAREQGSGQYDYRNQFDVNVGSHA
jgi:hypothetical protein